MEQLDLVLIRMKNPGGFLSRSFVGKLEKYENGSMHLSECLQYSSLLQGDPQGNIKVVAQFMTNDEVSEGTLQFHEDEFEFVRKVEPDHVFRKNYISLIAEYRAQRTGLIIPPGQRSQNQKTEVPRSLKPDLTPSRQPGELEN